VAVGSDKAGAYGLERARAAHVPTFVHPLRKGDDRVAWDAGLADLVGSYAPDLVVSAGFMKLVGQRVPLRFGDRFINTHPALLPSFPARTRCATRSRTG
jgi:phosphoribosylglycinamide formyltransferase-1